MLPDNVTKNHQADFLFSALIPAKSVNNVQELLVVIRYITSHCFNNSLGLKKHSYA